MQFPEFVTRINLKYFVFIINGMNAIDVKLSL